MNNNKEPKEGDLKVWHIPQVPMEAFEVHVSSPEEGKKILNILADYDLFQLENNVKPDYCNAQDLAIYKVGEWEDWYSDEYDSICDYELVEGKLVKILD